MFPIAEATLSLERIAEYWSREIHPPASWQEIFHTLWRAWWLGEFRAHSAHSRLQFLKAMFTSMHRDDLGIVFIVGGSGPLPLEFPEGSQVRRYKIRVPSTNTESWDEAACRDAFQALAEISSIERYPEFAVGLSSIQLSYAEFNTWCKKRGFSIPIFWQPRDQAVAQQKRKTWQAKLGCVLSATENAVLKVINELWPDGTLDQKANVRNKRIQDQLRLTHQSVSPRTIQRTLKKIRFA